MMLFTGLVGIVIFVLFLGILAWWIQEIPFTIIVVAVVGMLIYDFVRTLRYGDEGTRR